MSRSGFRAGHLLFISCLFLCWIIALDLGSPNGALPMEVVRLSPVEAFIKERLSLQLVSGILSATKFPNDHVHTLDYWQTNLRFGLTLNEPGSGGSLLRGNFEALFEVTYSLIYEGAGNYLGGATALIRYNFVQPAANFIPYMQAGAGIVFTDAYKDTSQDAIGQAIEFTPQASLGFRYLIHPNWSLDAEAMFHHISNANLGSRNDGINAFGGFIGVTYFFKSRR